MCFHGTLCSIPSILYATCLLSKKNVLTFDATSGVEGVRKDRLCAYML